MKTYLAKLFKKKNVEYKGNNYEIFEFQETVIGIGFTNTNQNKMFYILTGERENELATVLNKDIDNRIIAVLVDIDKAVEENENRVEISKIISNINSKTGKYYLRSGDSDLKLLLDPDFINFLDNQNQIDGDEGKQRITDIYSSIKETIISQNKPIEQILTSLFKNQKVVNSNLDINIISKLKENILIYGPSGTGKKETLKKFSKIYDVPIVITSAYDLVNKKISDVLKELYIIANGDIDVAKKGILVIDNFDKLFSKSEELQTCISNNILQNSLLKLLNGLVFPFCIDKTYIDFDTSSLTVVCLGNFDDILNKFNNYKILNSSDFTNYGISKEIIESFSKIIGMNPFLKDDIIKILNNSDLSPLNTYKNFFEMMNMDFEYDDEFVEWIADKSEFLKSGAKGLKKIFDECISDAMYEIFTGKYSKIKLVKPNNEQIKPYILIEQKEESIDEKSHSKKGYRKKFYKKIKK